MMHSVDHIDQISPLDWLSKFWLCTIYGPFLFLAYRIGLGFIVLDVVIDDSSTLITMLLLLLLINRTLMHCSTSMEDREEKLDRVYEEIEEGMTLIGATAIED